MKIIIENRSKLSDADVMNNVSSCAWSLDKTYCAWTNDYLKLMVSIFRNKKSIRFVATDYKPCQQSG